MRGTAGHVSDVAQASALLHGQEALIEQAEKRKASVRAKVEHLFRVIKCQFGCVKVRYRGLKKNTAQLLTLFALSDLWMVRSKLMGAGV